jgi:hypothetical protein
MSYRYDIFVSYKWGSDIKVWVDEVFVPILKNVLYELADDPADNDVFHDAKQNLPGGNIPAVLRDGVANSKCMVCVITKSYFTKSFWCTAELSAMLKREEETRVREAEGHIGLVFPLIFVNANQVNLAARNGVYDLDGARELLTDIQPLELDERQFFRISAGFKGTTAYDDLRFIIKDWVQNSMLDRIKNPPNWQPAWNALNYFQSRFIPPAPGLGNFPLPRL